MHLLGKRPVEKLGERKPHLLYQAKFPKSQVKNQINLTRKHSYIHITSFLIVHTIFKTMNIGIGPEGGDTINISL